MPSKQKLKKFERRIKEYDDLIYSINKWMEEFNQKILRLKRNILDEKELFEKLIFNFNQNFINYSYFDNFNYLNKYSKNFNNEYLNIFAKSSTFEEKSKKLFEYFLQEEKKKHIGKSGLKIKNKNILNCGKFNYKKYY